MPVSTQPLCSHLQATAIEHSYGLTKIDTQPRRRSQPAKIPSPASRCTAPDILTQILRYADDHTLAQTMRVSHRFYDIAGPMLYREIILHETDLDKLARGSEVVTRGSTRSRTAEINLKADLLKHVKVLEIASHPYECASHGARLFLQPVQQVETLRFVVKPIYGVSMCHCCDSLTRFCGLEAEDEDCEGLDYEDLMYGISDLEDEHVVPLSDFYFCPFLFGVQAKKVVLTSLGNPEILQRLPNTAVAASIFTIILSPDSMSIAKSWAKTIKASVKTAAEKASPVELRLLIAPWAERICNFREELDTWPLWHHRTSVTTESLAEFLAKVISSRYRTTVYFIEGPYEDARDNFVSKLPEGRPLPPISEVKEAILKCPTSSSRPARLMFKTRADYLREGVTDEIDPEELERWKKLEAIDRQLRDNSQSAGSTRGGGKL